MISTLKQVAMAEKLSIPQLQQAVKNGTIESWIGIPMIQERMKDQKQAQASAAAQQPQQPKVAEQVLMEAAQQGLEGLPTNLPQQYATGGIIGYAEGGELDDEDREDEREEEEFQQYAEMMLNRTPNVEQGLRNAPSMSYGQVQGQPLRAARQATASQYDSSGHKYDALANEYSKEIGLPASLARYMLKKETGGLSNPETARSKAGAYGPAQLMPATAKELGVDIRNPEENVKGGIRYLKQMYDRYNGDERLALAAYNAGPGNVDKALKSGKGIAGLPMETRGYVGYADGGLTEDDYAGGVYTSEDEGGLMARLKEMTRYGRMLPEDQRGYPSAKPIGLPAAYQNKPSPRALENAMVAKSPESVMPQTGALSKDTGTFTAPKEEPRAEPKPPATEAAKPDAYEDLMSMIRDRMAKREQEKDQDKWMGLLSAGLGMMGGTSPYGAVNVGQGAMYGLQQYGQARKQSAAEEAADVKNLMLATRYKDVGEYYKQKGAETAEQKQEALNLRRQEIAGNQMNKMTSQRVAEAQARFGKDINLMSDDAKKQYYAFIDSLKTDPRYIAYETQYYGLPENVKVTQRSSK